MPIVAAEPHDRARVRPRPPRTRATGATWTIGGVCFATISAFHVAPAQVD